MEAIVDMTAACRTQNILHLKSMQTQVTIEFDQLVELAKQLPTKQWTKLKKEVEKGVSATEKPSELVSLLLSAPTYSKKQLDEKAKTRKAINQWRTKVVLADTSILIDLFHETKKLIPNLYSMHWKASNFKFLQQLNMNVIWYQQ